MLSMYGVVTSGQYILPLTDTSQCSLSWLAVTYDTISWLFTMWYSRCYGFHSRRRSFRNSAWIIYVQSVNCYKYVDDQGQSLLALSNN